MPLAYDTNTTLAFPDYLFKDDVATIIVTGGRYGGRWVLNALPIALHSNQPRDSIGQITTARDERPSMAVDTALVWVNDACVRAGVKLAHWENRNHEYPPDQAPHFAAALFTIDRRNP